MFHLPALVFLIAVILTPGLGQDRADPGAVLARAGDYVVRYQREFSAAVAEERYQQALVPSANGPLGRRVGSRPPVQERVLRSDLLLVRLGGRAEWLPFRDVYEADGVPVRDREQRLQQLFLDASSTSLEQARRISEESSRYNLGDVTRTINVPTLPLRFLEPENRPRFSFRRRSEEVLAGVSAWRVGFTEKARPTIIRTPGTGRDVPATGSLWIDPMSGRVLKAEVEARSSGVTMELVVTFRPNDALGLWVPAEMRERYEYPAGTITAVATYDNFRRYTVTTREELRIR